MGSGEKARRAAHDLSEAGNELNFLAPRFTYGAPRSENTHKQIKVHMPTSGEGGRRETHRRRRARRGLRRTPVTAQLVLQNGLVALESAHVLAGPSATTTSRAKPYLLLTVLLFAAEVLIALAAHDTFVRRSSGTCWWWY